MAIDRQDWHPITHHKVVHSFLCSERDKAKQTGFIAPEQIDALLDKPEFTNEHENFMRIALLDRFRGRMFDHFPQFVDWYEVRNLKHCDLSRLHAINSIDWCNKADLNELNKVAIRKRMGLTLPPEIWDPPILIGHERRGPFAILEGNNRLVAYAGSGRTDLCIPVLIGLSPQLCIWNILDCRRPVSHIHALTCRQ